MSGSSNTQTSLGPTSAAEAERLATRLRGELAETLDQLGTNLVPTRLASEAVAAVADRTPPWLKDYWQLARGPVGLGIVGATAASIALGLLAKRARR